MKKNFLLLGLTFVMGVSLLAMGVSPPNTNVTANETTYTSLDDAFVKYANWSGTVNDCTNNANIQNFLIINNINNNGSVYYDADVVAASSLNTEINYINGVYDKAKTDIVEEDNNYNQNINNENKRISQRLNILEDNKSKLNTFTTEISELVTEDDNGNISNMQTLVDVSDIIIVAGNVGTDENYAFGILINDGKNKVIYTYQNPYDNDNLTNYSQRGYEVISVSAFNSVYLKQEQMTLYLRYVALLYAGGYTTEEVNNFIVNGTLFTENIEDMISDLATYQQTNCQHIFNTINNECEICGYSTPNDCEISTSSTENAGFSCDICDNSEVVIDTSSDEHKSSKWVEIKEATCISQGEEVLVCDECGLQLSTRKTDMTEHTYEEKIITEPTCSTYGKSSLVCTICGDIKSTQKLAKLSHTPMECEDGIVRCKDCNKELGYMVTYDANGGKCDRTSDYGEVGTNITLPTPTKDGYVFNGWYNELGVKITTLKITSNINLKAMWTSIPIKITYNADGGKASEQTQTYYTGDTLKLPTATRNGYSFDGWYINDVLLINETIIEFNESTVATAKWTKLELEKPKVIKATKNSLTVEPVEDATGYQVYISDNTKFNPRKSYSNTNETINVAEMSRGDSYIAIRTVGKDSTGNYVYSAWKYYKY